ncbi:hypothetical protein Btru_040113 [Bulinus truncatus]|nr:hypothetical protein Btru_040113 [Bulinus truncatus]
MIGYGRGRQPTARRESSTLKLNGQDHSLAYCNITLTLNTHLVVTFCTYNLSRPLMYRLLNGESLVSSAHPARCLNDDILVEEESGHFELGYVDECQRTAAYYCEVSAIREIADCNDCTEGRIAEVVGYMCMSVGVASAFFLGICCFSTETDMSGYSDFPEFSTKSSETPQIKPISPNEKNQGETQESENSVSNGDKYPSITTHTN